MIVDSPEELKEWMIGVLEPLCDAEPVKLAKYVLALINKDLPDHQLRASMVDKLDVFLSDHTVHFVDSVFTALRKKSYKHQRSTSEAGGAGGVAAPGGDTRSATAASASDKSSVRVHGSRLSPDSTTAADNASGGAGGSGGGGERRRARHPQHHHHQSGQSSAAAPPHPQPLLQSGRLRQRSWNERRRRSPPVRRPRRQRSPLLPLPAVARARSRSPLRRKSRSRSPQPPAASARSRSPVRARSRSPMRARSRSPVRARSRSPVRARSRSPVRARSRSPIRARSRSPARVRSRSPVRARSRSPLRSGPRTVTRGSKVTGPAAAPARNRSPLLGHSPNSLHKKAKSPVRGARCVVDGAKSDPVNGVTDLRAKLKSNATAATSSSSVAAAAAAPVKQRCSDFDEKGYCMQGDQCPFDHGLDPVVLKDVTLPDVLHYGRVPAPSTLSSSAPSVACAASVAPSLALPPPPTVALTTGLLPFNSMVHPHSMMSGAECYNPDAPSLTPAYMGVGGHMLTAVPQMNTAVPPPPIPPPSSKRLIWMGDGPMIRPHFDYGRVGRPNTGPGGPRLPPPSVANCCLELRKVPPGLNQISHLNQHFSKFGTITNLQVCYNGDPTAALLTFSKPTEAKAAYKSTEAVLGNRFIKLFWHNRLRAEQQQQQQQQQLAESVGEDDVDTGSRSAGANDNCGNGVAQQQQSSGAGAGAGAAGVRDKQADIDAIQRNQQILAARLSLRAVTKEKQKEAQKLALDLQKRKHELLEKQLSQQRALLTRLESRQLSGQERETLLKTVRALQQAIVETQAAARTAVTSTSTSTSVTGGSGVKTAAAAAAAAAGAAAHAPAKLSKEETERQMLDMEMELYQRQQSGDTDTDQLQRRVTQLKQQLNLLNRLPPAGATRGTARRARGRGAGAGAAARHQKVVDHRPRRLCVSGFPAEHRHTLKLQLAKFGEVIDTAAADGDTAAAAAAGPLLLQCSTRQQAELALSRCHSQLSRRHQLTVAWCADNSNNTSSMEQSSSAVLASQLQYSTGAVTANNNNNSNSSGAAGEDGGGSETGETDGQAPAPAAAAGEADAGCELAAVNDAQHDNASANDQQQQQQQKQHDDGENEEHDQHLDESVAEHDENVLTSEVVDELDDDADEERYWRR